MSTPETWLLFLTFSRHKLLNEYWPRLRTCVELLNDEQVWWRPNPSSNSVGNLVLHLNGNVGQWLVASFRGEFDGRNRPAEFKASGGASAHQLLQMLEKTMSDAAAVLAALTEEDLRRPMVIQGYEVTGLAAVYQVVEHFGLHYGQVAYITKMLHDQSLGFYRELDRTGRVS
ncbi:MAG: DUF1572 family protein [Acidobacteriota bacterium]